MYVSDGAGPETKGKVSDISPSSLQLLVNGERRDFDAATCAESIGLSVTL